MIPSFLRSEVFPFASVEILTARLTDSAPPLVTICAWCADFNPREAVNRGVSHGMCPPCAARFEQEIA